ncbi:MAG TPA: NUDIX domain-containing protein [Longimicrobium sp.]|nr:NUDIX domain-containing protein [Longimicrobium sp.]
MSNLRPGDLQPAQSAALPYRLRDGQVEVLLVTPRGGAGWIIPKGKVEARLGPAESAAREAEEEGGVRGEIDPDPFDRYRHGGEDGPLVTVFLLRVTRELASWAEAHERERHWASLDKVAGLVLDPGLQRVMDEAAAYLPTHALAAKDAGDRPRRKRSRRFGPALLLAALLGAAIAFLI